MIFLPGARITSRLMSSPAVILGLAILYVILIAPNLFHAVPLLLRPELPAIRGLLGSEVGAMVSWAHFLAFDLFVGRWIYLDGRSRGITAWVTSSFSNAAAGADWLPKLFCGATTLLSRK